MTSTRPWLGFASVVPNLSAMKWFSTKTHIGSATSADRGVFSSGSLKNLVERSTRPSIRSRCASNRTARQLRLQPGRRFRPDWSAAGGREPGRAPSRGSAGEGGRGLRRHRRHGRGGGGGGGRGRGG